MLAGLRQGVKIVTMPKFDPELYMNLLQTHRVMRFCLINFGEWGLQCAVAGGIATCPVIRSYNVKSH